MLAVGWRRVISLCDSKLAVRAAAGEYVSSCSRLVSQGCAKLGKTYEVLVDWCCPRNGGEVLSLYSCNAAVRATAGEYMRVAISPVVE